MGVEVPIYFLKSVPFKRVYMQMNKKGCNEKKCPLMIRGLFYIQFDCLNTDPIRLANINNGLEYTYRIE